MTNKEIKEICISSQKRHGGSDYPNYKFKVTQTVKETKIFWEYLDGECWTIVHDGFLIYDEHKTLMNEQLEFTNSIPETINSIVYYMVTRY